MEKQLRQWMVRVASVTAIVAVVIVASAMTEGSDPRKSLSGDLAKPIAQYTGAEFAALVKPLRYGQGVERQRQCRGLAACEAGMKVAVRVDAVSDADSLAAGNLPTHGVIAARLLNRGEATEARYNLRPGSQYAYYLIVLPAAGGKASWIVEELDWQGGQFSHRSVATGRFEGCGHKFVRGARADFQTCAQSAVAKGGIQLISLNKQGGDPPLWLACALGCCTAEK